MIIGGFEVSNNSRTLIIAEAGINHDGNFNQALELIDVAKEAGADVVKFQLFSAKKMISSRFGTFKNAAGKIMTMQNVLEESAMPTSWIPELMAYCKKQCVGFLCTACDEDSADILKQNGVDAFKIASSELSHIPLLKHIAKFHKPMIVSEAGAYLSDVDIALRAITEEDNKNIALLHCVYKYPTPLEECNLNIIPMYKQAFPDIVVGYSDHTLDPVKAPVTAVLMGAKIIEKHFTIDKTLPGADHSFALNPEELALMCKSIRTVEELEDNQKIKYICQETLGSSYKTLNRIEEATRRGSYRCLMTIDDVKKGDRMTTQNMAVLRPGKEERGLDPCLFDVLLENGACFTKDLKNGMAITWECVLESK